MATDHVQHLVYVQSPNAMIIVREYAVDTHLFNVPETQYLQHMFLHGLLYLN